MTRVPPSQQIAQLIGEFFSGCMSQESDVTSTLVKSGAQRLLQELLEAEVDDHLGRRHYQRQPEEEAIVVVMEMSARALHPRYRGHLSRRRGGEPDLP